MNNRIRFALFAALAIAVAIGSICARAKERRINPDVFDQLRDDMSLADLIALLGEPLPEKYGEGRIPLPVELIAGCWDIVKMIQSTADGAMNGGIAKRLEFVGVEYGISVSFNPAGRIASWGLLRKALPVDPLERAFPGPQSNDVKRRSGVNASCDSFSDKHLRNIMLTL